MNPRIRLFLALWLLAIAAPLAAQSLSLVGPTSNAFDRWLLHTRYRPRVATAKLQLRGDSLRTGQVILANRSGLLWQKGDHIPGSPQEWRWVRPEEIERLHMKRRVPFGTHLRRTGRMVFYGVWGINTISSLSSVNAGYWLSDLGLLSYLGTAIGIGAGGALAMIDGSSIWPRYHFEPDGPTEAARRYPSLLWGLRRMSLYRSGDTTALDQAPFWEMSQATQRWSVVVEAGHDISYRGINYLNSIQALTPNGAPVTEDFSYYAGGLYDPPTRWYSLSVGYALRPAVQVGLRYALPMGADVPWSRFDLPFFGRPQWSVRRGAQVGLWGAIDLLPPNLLPLLRTRVQVGGGYFLQPLTLEQSISIDSLRVREFPHRYEQWNLRVEQQSRRWLHGLEGFVRLRQRLSEHVALLTTVRRQWTPQRTQAAPLTLSIPEDLSLAADRIIFSPAEFTRSGTFLTSGIEVRW